MTSCDRMSAVSPGVALRDAGEPTTTSPRSPAAEARRLDADIDDFVAAFRSRHGRPPRVLHVGNIANNAYLNAKLLNERGFDCDVLCHDYYHVMGCPEWMETAFEGDIGDPFFPRWWAVDLKGYLRPRWFVQGTFKACCKYLIARRKSRSLESAIRWRLLEIDRFHACSRSPSSAHVTPSYSLGIVGERVVNYVMKSARQSWEAMRFLWAAVRRAIDALASLLTAMVIAIVAAVQVPFLLAGMPIRTPGRVRLPRVALQRKRAEAVSTSPVPTHDSPAPPPSPTDPNAAATGLITEFRARFPERFPPLSADDVLKFVPRAREMAPLFQCYDIVQCYSTEPIYGMLAGGVPIVAFEHGTIREIPFEDSSVGRMTLLAYAKASAVVLTNADNLERARRIRPDWDRIVAGLHRFDERPIVEQMDTASSDSELSLRFGFDRSIRVLFAPARHDHVVKGNDRLIEAIAIARAENPGRFKVVLVEWGNDVDKSKARIAELGIEDAVEWVSPLQSDRLIRAYSAVDCVIDQFNLPCFGGVPLDVMVVGRCPVMTYIDDDILREYYGETLPVLNCRSVEEIADSIGVVIRDPEACARITRDARRWMDLHHTHRHVVHWLVQAYRMTGILDA